MFVLPTVIMPPLRSDSLQTGRSHMIDPGHEFQQQWAHPADVFSVLLLLGGEIVNRALAQLSGGIFTPVAFSFGA